jgi:5-methylcytosine-specific restriction endonuclease McrA
LSRPNQNHDNPYRDDSPSRSAPSRDTRSRPARKSPKPAQKSAPKPLIQPARHRAEVQERREDAGTADARRRSPRRKRGRRTGGTPELQLTSHPTGRSAYLATRVWLLERHGPVCAYCGVRFTPQVMTLDHVAPRRGQTAYDRRDNLVLACPGCNAQKRDLPPTAYLLGSRTRAANLLRYGAHLSPMLLEIARTLAPDVTPLPPEEPRHSTNGNGRGWASLTELDDGESPYRD